MTSQAAVKSKKLEGILGKQSKGDFDHDNISRTEIVQVHIKVDENFQLFQKLHMRYCEIRILGKDNTEEDGLVEQDGQYSEEVEGKVFPLLDKFTEYDRSFNKFEADKAAKQEYIGKLPELVKEYQRAVEDFQNSKDSANKLINC